VTTRGLKEKEMKVLGQLIAKVLEAKGEAKVVAEVKAQVQELCQQFPLYPELQDQFLASGSIS